MEANSLVPLTQEDMDNQDQLLASLMDIARSTAPKIVLKKKRFKSRFFFRITRSVHDDVEVRKKQLAPKTLTHVDSEVEQHLKDYRKYIPKELEANISQVREFFLREIAPITLAADAGAVQAKEVVKRLVKSDVDGTQFEKFERMMAHAVDIKMARFVARQLGMTAKEATEILLRMQPRTPLIAPIPMGPPNERPQERQQPKQSKQRKAD
jgi:hypothetical protein